MIGGNGTTGSFTTTFPVASGVPYTQVVASGRGGNGADGGTGGDGGKGNDGGAGDFGGGGGGGGNGGSGGDGGHGGEGGAGADSFNVSTLIGGTLPDPPPPTDGGDGGNGGDGGGGGDAGNGGSGGFGGGGAGGGVGGAGGMGGDAGTGGRGGNSFTHSTNTSRTFASADPGNDGTSGAIGSTGQAGQGAAGGFGAGGGAPSGGTGGGGLGAGGDIFVAKGGTLILDGGLLGGSLSGGSALGGNGFVDGSNHVGDGIFLQANEVITLAATGSKELVISDQIMDQTGAGGLGSTAGTGALNIAGTGTVELDHANKFGGGIDVESRHTRSCRARCGGMVISFPAQVSGDPNLEFTTANAPTNAVENFGTNDNIIVDSFQDISATYTANHLTLEGLRWTYANDSLVGHSGL